MKLFLCLFLCFTLTLSLPILGAYQRVDEFEIQANPEIENLASYGLSEIVNIAFEEQKISSKDFELSKVVSVYRQVVNGINYKFECQFKDYRGSTIDANFRVFYQPGSDEISLESYNYRVRKVGLVELVEESFTEISIREIQYSAEIQTVLTFGIKELLDKGISNDQFPDDKYDVTGIKSISRQIISNAIFYRCDIELGTKTGFKIQAAFTVYDQPSSDTRYLTDYSFDSLDQQATVYASRNRADEDAFIELEIEEVEEDEEIYELLEYGAQQVIRAAIRSKKIPDSEFDITNIESALWQVITNGEYYKFQCMLENEEGAQIDALFTVFYDSATRRRQLSAYSYKITSSQETTSVKIIGPVEEDYTEIDIEEIQYDRSLQTVLTYGIKSTMRQAIRDGKLATSDFSIREIIQAESQVVGNGVFYRFSCDLTNRARADIQLNFAIYAPANTNKRTLTAYSYIIQTTTSKEFPQRVRPRNNAYRSISVETVESDTTIKNILDFGVRELISDAIDSGKIPEADFELSTIYEAFSQSVSRGSFYKFSCQLADRDGSAIDATFTVYIQGNQRRRTLASYNYVSQVTKTTTFTEDVNSIKGNFTQVDILDIVSDRNIQQVLQFGIQQVVNKGILEGKVPSSAFDVKTIYGIFKRETKDGLYFKIDVELDNNNGASLKTVFTVFQRTSTQERILSEYSYNVEIVNTVTTTTEVKEEEFKAIEISKLSTDKTLQSVVSFGVSSIIKKGIEDKKIPASQFNITKVISAASQTTSRGTYYKFDLTLQNVQGAVITTTFTVFANSQTKNNTLSAYSYKITKTTTTTTNAAFVEANFVNVDIKEIQFNKELQSCLQFGVQEILQKAGNFSITKIVSIARQIVEGNLYYKFNIELANTQNSTIVATFTVFFQPTTQEKTLQAYSYNTKTVKTTTVTTTTEETTSTSSVNATQKFEKVETETAAADSQTQEVLEFGVKECVENLKNYNVLPSADFTIDKVLDVFKQEQSSDSESYRFRVRITNKVNIAVNVNFNVKISKSSSEKTLTAYSAEGTSSTTAQNGELVLVDYDKSRQQELQIGTYEQVGISEVKSNTDIQAALQFGIQQTLKTVVQKESFAAVDFKLKEVRSIYREFLDRQTYKVSSVCTNSQGQNVDLNFIVKYQSTGTKQLSSYSYIVY